MSTNRPTSLPPSVLRGCSFDTERLSVHEWKNNNRPTGKDDAAAVADLLTASVTKSLPPHWQGSYTVERARQWLSELTNDPQTTLLFCVEKQEDVAATTPPATALLVGLMILFEIRRDDLHPSVDDELTTIDVDVRLGYLFSETCWGRGLASELVGGFVHWCRASAAAHPRSRMATLTGGVARDNPASRRVLEKNGFCLLRNRSPEEGEDILQLSLLP